MEILLYGDTTRVEKSFTFDGSASDSLSWFEVLHLIKSPYDDLNAPSVVEYFGWLYDDGR